MASDQRRTGQPGTETNLDFRIEKRAGYDTLVWNDTGCRPATEPEVQLWQLLAAQRAPAAAQEAVAHLPRRSIDWLHGLHSANDATRKADAYNRPVPDEQTIPVYAAPVTAAPAEMSPEFTDTARAAIAWVLWHHQGGSSPVGQPLRFALGMGANEPLPDWRIAEAKRYGAWAGATTAEFHKARASTLAAPGIDLTALADRITDHLCEHEYDIGGRDELLRHVREAIDASSKGATFPNDGNSEAQFVADGERLNCPACGGSGHVEDSPKGGSTPAPRFELTNGQIAQLADFAGTPVAGAPLDEQDVLVIQHTEAGHSGPGLYAHYDELPEEGAIYLDGQLPGSSNSGIEAVAVQRAFGYMWHVNHPEDIPAGHPFMSPGRAAVEARKELRGMLTHEQRGEGINWVRQKLLTEMLPQASGTEECAHNWVDARNQVVKSGEFCTRCGKVRASDAEVRNG